MTVELRLATRADLPFLVGEDRHVRRAELVRIIEAGRITAATEAASVVGWLRWGLFWDEIPFMNMLFVVAARRGEGIGTRLVAHWENAQRVAGFDSVMTSTLSNENAQHLYRRLGYVDSGCLLLPGDPLEIVLRKPLRP